MKRILLPSLIGVAVLAVVAVSWQQLSMVEAPPTSDSASSVLGATSPLKHTYRINIPTVIRELLTTLALTVEGDTLIGGSLSVSGPVSFSNASVFDGAITITSNINARGITMDLGNGRIIASNLVSSIQVGEGLSLAGTTSTPILTNTDLGSAQPIYKTIKVGESTTTANSNSDTLSFSQGSGIELSLSDDTVTITATTPTTAITSSGSYAVFSSGITRLGLGTNTPSNTLEVDSSVSDTSGITLTQLTSGSPVGVGGGKVLSVDSGGKIILVEDQTSTAAEDVLPITSTGGTLYFNGTNWVGSTNLYHNGGNVGISTDNPLARLHVVTNSAGTVGNIIQATTGQTANLQEWQNAAGTPLSYIDAAGAYNGTFIGNLQGTVSLSGFTAGSVPFVDADGDLTQDNASLYWKNDSKFLGIGTAAPTSELHIFRSTQQPLLTIERANDAIGAGGLMFRRTRLGTTPLIVNDHIGSTYYQMYNSNSEFVNSVQFTAFVEDPTDGSEDAGLFFHTITDGSYTEKLRLTAAGNLGIGTTSPSYKLHVQGANFSNLALFENYWVSSGTNANVVIRTIGTPGQNDGGVLTLGRADGTSSTPTIVSSDRGLGLINAVGYDGSSYITAAQIRFSVDGTVNGVSDVPGRIAFLTTPDGSGTPLERLRITNAGNVGIGTSSPAGRLDIDSGQLILGRSNDPGTTGYTRINSASGSGVAGQSGIELFAPGGIAFNAYTGNSGPRSVFNHPLLLQPGGVFGTYPYGLRIYLDGSYGGAPKRGLIVDSFSGNTLPVIEANSAGSNIFTLLPSGNLGIGTSTPAAKLTLRDTSNATTLGASNSLQLYGGTILGSRTEIGLGYAGGTYTPGIIGFVNVDGTSNTFGDIYFGTRNVSTDTAVTERMRITNSGSVGIGTATPGEKLDVSGTIRTSNGSSNLVQMHHDTWNPYIEWGGGNQLRLRSITGSGNSLVVAPHSDSQYSLGSSGLRWGTIHASSIYSPNLRTEGEAMTIGPVHDYGITWRTNNLSRGIITNGGLFGIGTTAPGAKLEVVNTIRIGSTAAINTSEEFANLDFYSNDGSAGAQKLAGAIRMISSADGGWSTANHEGNMAFYTLNSDFAEASEKMRLTGDGYLGIGLTNPTSALDINGGIELLRANRIRFSPSSADNTHSASIGGSEGSLWNYLQFFTGGAGGEATPKMVIDHNGNLGIGTTSPLSRLHMAQEVIGGTTWASVQNTRSGLETAGIRFKVSADTADNYWNAGLIFERTDTPGTAQGSLHLALDADSTGNVTAADAKLTILTNGNVGIGTTAPDRRITIQGVAGGENRELSFKDPSGNTISTIGSDVVATNDFLLSTVAGMRFYTGSTIGASGIPTNERMRITSSGNVGIGTTSPSAKLNISDSYSGIDSHTGIRFSSTRTNSTSGTGLATYFVDNDLTFAGTYHLSNMIGLHNKINLTNTSTNNQVRSIVGRMNVSGGGAAGLAALFQTQFEGAGSGSISALRMIDISNFSNASNTLVNTYGLYIGDLTAGTQTNQAYSIYASDADTRNYFAGRVGIGTASPNAAALLDILGGGLRMDSTGGTANVQFEVKHDTTALRLQNLSGTTFIGSSGNLAIRAGTTGGLGASIGGVDAMHISSTGGITINEDGGDLNFRVEGDTSTHLLFADAGLDRVGIGQSIPSAKLHITAPGSTVGLKLNNNDASGYMHMQVINNGTQIELGADANSPAYVKTSTNHPLYFGVNNTEMMRILSNGNLGIGTTTPSTKLHVRAEGTTGTIATFESDNNTGCTLSDGGIIACSSDERLKDNISSLSTGLSVISSLSPSTFTWKQGTSTTQAGFIAQAVENILPNLVFTNSQGFKSLSMTGMVPYIVKAIQEQQGQIDSLSETRVLGSTDTSQMLSDLEGVETVLEAIQARVEMEPNLWRFVVRVIFSKPVEFLSEVRFGGRVVVDDTLIFDNQNLAGEAVIQAGNNSYQVSFDSPLPVRPVVQITPLSPGMKYYLSRVDETGFEIRLEEVASENQGFFWSVVLNQRPGVSGTSSYAPAVESETESESEAGNAPAGDQSTDSAGAETGSEPVSTPDVQSTPSEAAAASGSSPLN